jgi:hypothetical protein
VDKHQLLTLVHELSHIRADSAQVQTFVSARLYDNHIPSHFLYQT